MKSNIFRLIGIILFVLSIIAGLYVGGWICFVGGIIDIIEGAKQTPIESIKIGLGALKFISASLVGWLTFAVGVFFSKIFIDAA
jgi:hypothetical protein